MERLITMKCNKCNSSDLDIFNWATAEVGEDDPNYMLVGSNLLWITCNECGYEDDKEN